MTKYELYRQILGIQSTLGDMIRLFRLQNFNRGERLFQDWVNRYGIVLTELVNCKTELNAGAMAYGKPSVFEENLVMTELQGLLGAMEQKDYVLMADLMELQTKPFLEELVQPLRDLIMEEGSVPELNGYQLEQNGVVYSVEPTTCGAMTLALTDPEGTWYLHSNASPYAEGESFAQQYYDEETEEYVIYGLGLGYHVLALCKQTHGLVPITVYESDLTMIELARANAAMFGGEQFTDYEGKNLRIVHDPSLSAFAGAASDPKVLVAIHYPSIRNIRNESVRQRLHQLFVQDSSIRNQIGEMLANFRNNIKNCTGYVDELKERFSGRDVILVAAGPSLDRNVEGLKALDRIPESKRPVVLCVGTAFRKLMGMGIRPDYVIFLDASERIRGQIRGLEGEDVTALIGSTATLSIGRDYAGRKYLICQKGFPEAEAYAAERNLKTYETGGSVATLAYDVSVGLGAKRVIAIGLDLAYTNRKLHADRAGKCGFLESVDGLIEVPSVNGGVVYTTQAMNMYREWFEQYIAARAGCGVDFIDATEGGALISGMKICSLRDVLSLPD